MYIEKNYRADTLSNAQRLLADSVLLHENDRVESSIALAVLAIEELGKYLIECWNVKNAANNRRFPSHIEKQSATFVILHAKEFSKTSPKKIRQRKARGDMKLRSWGEYSEQMQWAKAGFYEDLRMLCTYSDKEHKWPDEIIDNIHEFEVKDLHKIFQKALLESRNKKYMEIAAVVYENGLGDL